MNRKEEGSWRTRENIKSHVAAAQETKDKVRKEKKKEPGEQERI